MLLFQDTKENAAQYLAVEILALIIEDDINQATIIMQRFTKQEFDKSLKDDLKPIVDSYANKNYVIFFNLVSALDEKFIYPSVKNACIENVRERNYRNIEETCVTVSLKTVTEYADPINENVVEGMFLK